MLGREYKLARDPFSDVFGHVECLDGTVDHLHCSGNQAFTGRNFQPCIGPHRDAVELRSGETIKPSNHLSSAVSQRV